jgi:hypothetical protein
VADSRPDTNSKNFQIAMKSLLAYALLLSCLLFQNACKPEVVSEDEPIYFSGLTTVDASGTTLGETDTTDWRFDDVWTAKEKALFPANSLLTCLLKSDSLDGVFLQPNPCKEVFLAGFQTPFGATWHFRWVDENFKVLKKFDWENPTIGYNALLIQTDSFPKDTIRLYYEVLHGACVHRGHGDILIQN